MRNSTATAPFISIRLWSDKLISGFKSSKSEPHYYYSWKSLDFPLPTWGKKCQVSYIERLIVASNDKLQPGYFELDSGNFTGILASGTVRFVQEGSERIALIEIWSKYVNGSQMYDIQSLYRMIRRGDKPKESWADETMVRFGKTSALLYMRELSELKFVGSHSAIEDAFKERLRKNPLLRQAIHAANVERVEIQIDSGHHCTIHGTMIKLGINVGDEQIVSFILGEQKIDSGDMRREPQPLHRGYNLR